jgi:2,4-dienoyl-CoA reductase-like NADH-dependent reductase (Old Yellow Enzyme family)
LSLAQIREIQNAFVAATVRAVQAGFQMLEIHGAHGYLMHSFHSPLSNARRDEYGGSFENRIRFTLETVRLVRPKWPDSKPLAVRLSCTDWFEGGWTLEESIELAKKLKAEGVDLIDCSSGAGTPKARVPAGASFRVPLAEAVRRQAAIPTAAVGLITDPMQADEIIRNGRADGHRSCLAPSRPRHRRGRHRYLPESRLLDDDGGGAATGRSLSSRLFRKREKYGEDALPLRRGSGAAGRR